MGRINEIVCPCGKILVRTDGGGSGLKNCLRCGRMVHFEITETGVHIRLEDREALLFGRQP